MVGIPGSGKSTWIQNNLPSNIPIVSRDIIRENLGMCKVGEKCKGTTEEENKVTSKEYKEIQNLIKNKKDFVTDDTNLNSHTKEFIEYIKSLGDVNLICIIMKTPLNICIERRKDQIPSNILKSMYENLGEFS